MDKQKSILVAVETTGFNKYKDRITGFSILEDRVLRSFSNEDEGLCLTSLYEALEGKRIVTFDGADRLLPFLIWRDRKGKLGLDWKGLTWDDQKVRLKALRPFHPTIPMRAKAFAQSLEEGLLEAGPAQEISLSQDELGQRLWEAILIASYLENLAQKLTFELLRPRTLIGQVYHTERLDDGVFLRIKTDANPQAFFLQTDGYRVDGTFSDMEVTLFSRPVQTESGPGLAYAVQPEVRNYVLIADGQKVLIEALMTSVNRTLEDAFVQIGL